MKNMQEKRRLDYFVVWGYGVEYLHEIVNLIDENREVDILYVKKKQIEDIDKYIADIYAKEWPSVPKEHTLSKTGFLHHIPQQTALILVMNRHPRVRTQHNKNPLFRMPESATVKDIKIRIRNEYDPNKGGRGKIPLVPGYHPDQHVIHASDFPAQIQNALDVFDMEDVEYWESYWINRHSPLLSMEQTKNIEVCNVDDILMKILNSNRQMITVEIQNSPHYKFLNDEKEHYEQYWKMYCGDILKENHCPSAFERLFVGFEYLRPPYHNSHIKVEKINNKYYSVDGDHRLAILKTLGFRLVEVEVVSA